MVFFKLFRLLTLSGDKQRTGTSGCNNLELVPALDCLQQQQSLEVGFQWSKGCPVFVGCSAGGCDAAGAAACQVVSGACLHSCIVPAALP
jgi:hypothetical protein